MSTRHRALPPWGLWLTGAAAIAASLLAMDTLRLFGGQQLLGSLVAVDTQYFYALIALLLPLVFLLFPPWRGARTFPLDLLLALVAVAAPLWLFFHAEQILDEGWEFGAPPRAILVSVCLWGLMLEAVRRTAGWVLFVLVVLFSFYPLFADRVPGIFAGLAVPFDVVASYHALGTESLLGLPFRAFANLVIGFLVFGIALQHTGGGRFFIDLAFALLGRVRGGPAKVAIVASGLMGSMSGSVITNVLTTGQLTIPTMKQNGIRADYAAGVEACASTGGVLLPPIMGSTAFVMATFLSVPYAEVAIAATIPALLFFFGLFMQVDAYAARAGLAGIADADAPRLGATLRAGWYHLGSFVVLVVLLVVLKQEAVAPWLATAVLVGLNQCIPGQRWDRAAFGAFCLAAGALLAELLAILSGVGLIVGALSLTGLSGTLVNELLYLADGSMLALLLMGALTSFFLGIGLTVTAAYIFLAIVLAPALVQGGLDPMAVHLFILYWGMLSFITPPVALGAFAAAAIAGTSPMRTGFTAMRLGSVVYFIPFFFVLDPAYLFAGDLTGILRVILEAGLGIAVIAGGLQGYLPFFGRLQSRGLLGGAVRAVVVLGGFCIALPDPALLTTLVSGLQLLAAGVTGTLAALLLDRFCSPGSQSSTARVRDM
ncbi:MAG: TRAP transporter fused permease subunit [Pseudomonadales bacterium]|jgi:TRAP transporter 4TM/12TM fusion protein|nr:TRAP transporter fused permease subunit [Pseudomonadales bacterium]